MSILKLTFIGKNAYSFALIQHIAVMTRDVYAASAELEARGVRFQKRPDEGRMKGV
jgi:4-hydroxyphenylpyruvate dioxygenase-like putative hemolysin